MRPRYRVVSAESVGQIQFQLVGPEPLFSVGRLGADVVGVCNEASSARKPRMRRILDSVINAGNNANRYTSYDR